MFFIKVRNNFIFIFKHIDLKFKNPVLINRTISDQYNNLLKSMEIVRYV